MSSYQTTRGASYYIYIYICAAALYASIFNNICCQYLLQVMTPHQRVVMAVDSRKEMEEWLSSIKQAALEGDKSVSNH